MTLSELRKRIDLAASRLGWDAKVEIIIGGQITGDYNDLEVVKLDFASPCIDRFLLGSSLLTPPPGPTNDSQNPPQSAD